MGVGPDPRRKAVSEMLSMEAVGWGLCVGVHIHWALAIHYRRRGCWSSLHQVTPAYQPGLFVLQTP